ncbi:MAG: tRNA epoxyqueuosine(34) reductase QueG [Duncaniella sp.]|nr:tRNA epoxyqueuosine(34) reductase QueG [Duncaniella sp.]
MTKAEIKELLAGAGVFRSAVARVRPVDEASADDYRAWISEGKHGEMAYLEKYDDLRSDPRRLLDGARSVISCAFNYHSSDEGAAADGSGGDLEDSGEMRPLQWAEYALGDDYHDVVRKRLSEVAEKISSVTGAECRVCVDTAPLRERYWAVKAGLGFIGLNNQLILPGAGSRFFLGEILTTLPLEPDEPTGLETCGECGRCLKACPGKALSAGADGRVTLDARRCLSYLTIEYRGELPEDVRLGRHVYGCDECQRVCPHNRVSPLSEIEEFRPREAVGALCAERIAEMTQEEFSAIFRRSAIKRTKLSGLQRNALRIIEEEAWRRSREDGGQEG